MGPNSLLKVRFRSPQEPRHKHIFLTQTLRRRERRAFVRRSRAIRLELELDSQGHLNQAGTADGMHHLTDPRWALVEIVADKVAAAGRARRRRGDGRLALHRKRIESKILVDIVDGNIEAGVVGQIKDIEAILQRKTLSQLSNFNNRN